MDVVSSYVYATLSASPCWSALFVVVDVGRTTSTYVISASTVAYLRLEAKNNGTEDNITLSWQCIWRAQESDNSLCGCKKHWFFYLCYLLQVVMHSHHHNLCQLHLRGIMQQQEYHLQQQHQKQQGYMLINLIFQNQHSTYSHSARYDLTHSYATIHSTKVSHCASTSFYWWL